MKLKKNKINNYSKSLRFFSEILKIQKITKIEKKGKIIRFKIFVVTGNKKNTIGFGIGKDITFDGAFKKAINNSYKKLFIINPRINSRMKYKELLLKRTKI